MPEEPSDQPISRSADQPFWLGGARPGWLPTVVAAEVLPSDVSMGDLLAGIEECLAIERQIGALRATMSAQAFDLQIASRGSGRDTDGFIAEVAAFSHETEFATTRYLDAASFVRDKLPRVLTAFGAGEFTWRHVEAIASAADGLPEADLPQFETSAIRIAGQVTVNQARDRLRTMRDTMHPEGMAARHKAALRRRRGVMLDPAGDGIATVTIEFGAVDAVAIRDRIRNGAIHLHGQADETRTIGELQSDIARDLLLADLTTHDGDLDSDTEPVVGVSGDEEDDSDSEVDVDSEPDIFEQTFADPIDAGEARLSARAAGKVGTRKIRNVIGVVPEVRVLVPIDTLVPGCTGANMPGYIEGYGAIDPETIRRLIETAPSIARILTDQATGMILNVGPGRPHIPTRMKRALELRDETCRFPGCRRTVRSCELDHTVDVQFHGLTEIENLAHLCTRHHHIKHDTAWRTWQDTVARLHWTAPHGRRHTTYPAMNLATFVDVDDDRPAFTFPPRQTGPLPDEPPF